MKKLFLLIAIAAIIAKISIHSTKPFVFFSASLAYVMIFFYLAKCGIDEEKRRRKMKLAESTDLITQIQARYPNKGWWRQKDSLSQPTKHETAQEAAQWFLDNHPGGNFCPDEWGILPSWWYKKDGIRIGLIGVEK